MAARNTLRRSLLYGKLELPCKAVSSPHFTPRAPKKKSIQANKQHQIVPGSSQRFLDKSRLLTADCVTYDLEDSVTPHMKAEARSLVRRAIDQAAPPGIRERAVRINSVDSGLALGDLTEVVSEPRNTNTHTYTHTPKYPHPYHTTSNSLTIPAPIPKPNNNRNPQSQLRLRSHIRHRRHNPHSIPTTTNRKNPNFTSGSSRVRQVPDKPISDLRRVTSTPRPGIRSRRLRARSEYHADTLVEGVPVRAVCDSHRCAGGGSAVDD